MEQTFISLSSGGWKVQIKVPADGVLDRGSLPGLHTGAFLSTFPERRHSVLSLS